LERRPVTNPDYDGTAEGLRTLKLTPAWTPLRPHVMQSLFMWHPAPIKVCPAGRRSGKTMILKRKAVLQLIRKRDWPANVMIGAPTLDQVRKIYWDEIKALVPSAWVANINETRLEIRTRWGAMLKLESLDRPQRSEGVAWDWMGLDELADAFPRLLTRHLMPALGTLGHTVSCDLIGVPDEIGKNQAEYEEFWEKGLLWPKHPEICSFHWPSHDILEPAKMEFFKQTMDALEYAQEFGGRFITSGGKAVPRFDVALHVNADYCNYEPLLPIDWTLDFGVNPAASLICQTFKGRSWVLDEIVLQDSSTEVAVAAFIERCQQRGYSLRKVRVYGDAAGNSRHSNVGTTDYEILERDLKAVNVEWNQLTAAPLIKDTLNAVRASVVNAANEIRLHVHPRCKTLIADIKNAPWPSDLTKFHALAALRYYLFVLAEPTDRMEVSPLALPNLGGGGFSRERRAG
jgi:hypothetical protein